MDWFAETFDYFGNAEAMFEIAFHGPFGGRCFFVPLGFGWTGEQCKRLLAGRGIGAAFSGV